GPGQVRHADHDRAGEQIGRSDRPRPVQGDAAQGRQEVAARDAAGDGPHRDGTRGKGVLPNTGGFACLFPFRGGGSIMGRLHLILCGVVLPLFVVCLALSGCKKASEDEGGDEGGGGGGGGNRPKPAVKMTGIKMGAGVIKGKVVLKGAKPNVDKLTADL